MKCSHCGSQIPDGEVICPKCGLEVQLVPNYENLDIDMMVVRNNMDEWESRKLEEERQKRKKQLRNKKITHLLMAIGIILIAVIGVAIATNSILETMRVNSVSDYETAYEDALKSYESGQYSAAYNMISRAVELDGSKLDAQALKGRIAYACGNKDEAKSILLSLISDDDSFEPAYDYILEIYIAEQDYKAIYDLMSKVSNEDIKTAYAGYLVNPPTVSVEEGTYNADQTISLAADEGCVI